LPVGRYVLEQACRQVRSIRDRLGVELPVSVNLSPRQFQESSLLAQVAAALDGSGLAPASLMFEITESMVMEDLAGARDIMRKLTGLGVRLAIDDFGTGHSSLAYLKQFPVHEVKVDRAFVRGVAESQVDLAIVRAVIDIANAIGISAVAEGVETLDQVAGLQLLGCEIAQGYFFSQPLPASEFDDLLTGHFATRSASGAGVALGQPAHRGGQVRRVDDLEVGVEDTEPEGEVINGPPADLEQAAIRAERLDAATP
jgi:EAL domain-containing protein (putative c-di-GMP-specific phosphodiesterase class I)